MLSTLDMTTFISFLSTLALFLIACRLVWNVFLHPLHVFPGPLVCKMTALHRHVLYARGLLPHEVKRLHDRYGSVVRLGPNELSFIGSHAWHDIYSPRYDSPDHPEMVKDDRWYRFMGKDSATLLLSADFHTHEKLRRGMRAFFSNSFLRTKERAIVQYADLFMQRLKESSKGSQMVNINQWLSYFFFDVGGYLIYSVNFRCLENSAFHPCIKHVANTLKEQAMVQAIMGLGFKKLVQFITSTSFFKSTATLDTFTEESLEVRLDGEQPEKGFIDGLLVSGELKTLFDVQINATFMLVAATDTTAALVSAVLYFLTENKEALEKLTAEIRGSFASTDDITTMSTRKLPFLTACIYESLRLFPPAPSGLPRIVPPGGAQIDGFWVPENTIVSVPSWTIHRCEKHFANWRSYIPERHLRGAKRSGDNMAAFQPFGVGHRNCIGELFALAEARLLLSRILYEFDYDLEPGTEGWSDNQKAYIVWDRPPLNMTLRPCERAAGK